MAKDEDRHAPTHNFGELLGELRVLIADARQRVTRAVDQVQVQACWQIGRQIVEFEQGGADRAEYGKGLLSTLAESLTVEFGRGFDASNLRNMRLFYRAFPIRDALRHELSWTHYRALLRVSDAKARGWYMEEAAVTGLDHAIPRASDRNSILRAPFGELR